jgi:RNA polymerase sigma-70 factor (ECF subfamily)
VHSATARPFPLSTTLNAEQTLVCMAREDPTAFGALYDLHSDRIYRYLCTRTADREDAADLLQQVFLQAFDALPQYQPGKGPFVAWLFGIARNLSSNLHRARHPSITWDLVPEVLRADPGDLEAEVLRREDLTRLSRAFNALPADKRELLVLRFVAGLTAAEIASVVGKSHAATKKQLSRTLQSLKEHYHHDTP